jgi:hypothetical protein
MTKKNLVTAYDFGSNTNPSQSIFLRASGTIDHFWCGGKLLNRLSAVAAHAIPSKLYAIVATRHVHAAP